jgi:hypothetical protein
MSNINSATENVQCRSLTVPFYGTNLYLIERDGQPYTPMKPLVEGIGLDWGGQHKKFAANSNRWGISVMEIPSVGGAQSMICLPLRKLPGWLMTIDPGRLKNNQVRARVIQYQNECDDVLWQYWNEGIATNPRAYAVNPEDVLTEDQQNLLRQIVKMSAERLPKGRQGIATIKMWSKLKSHFGVPYRQIPRSEFTEAVSLLTRATTEWEVMDDFDAAAELQRFFEKGRYFVSMKGGSITMRQVPENAFVVAPDGFSAVIREPGMSFPPHILPDIISACVEKLSIGTHR